VAMADAPHAAEHSLEVHLPFLQLVLDDIKVLPLVVGHAPVEMVAAVLDAVWGGPETLIVISTDLSHYHDHATAQELDRATGVAALTAPEERVLLDVAFQSVLSGLNGEGPMHVDTATLPPTLAERHGVFVTLLVAGELNGCVGTLFPIEPLGPAVARLAWDA